MTNKKYYAGIGSQRITSDQSLLLCKVSFFLAINGHCASTGGALGSDTSIKFGVLVAYEFLKKQQPYLKLSSLLSCYLPWQGFNGQYAGDGYIIPVGNQHIEYSAQFHPAWSYLKRSEQSLMGRNANQILGQDLLTPVKFVVCITPDGVSDGLKTTSKTGGTGQAIRIASKNNVPVFNLNNDQHRQRLIDWMDAYNTKYLDETNINLMDIITSAFINHKGFDTVCGDLVSMALNGEVDILVHGLSCQNTEGKGFAKSLFDAFPDAMKADHATVKGDNSKLGTYSIAKVNVCGKELTIINAYTQYRYSNENILSCDYKAMRSVFSQINKDFPGRQIHMPKIGSGLARGCWISISHLIANETKKMKSPILVDFKESTEINSNQMALNL